MNISAGHRLTSFSMTLLLAIIMTSWTPVLHASEQSNHALDLKLQRLIDKGQLTKAVAFAESALKQAEKKHGKNHPQVGHVLSVLAHQHGYLGASDAEIPILERAIKIFERTPKKYAGELAYCLRSLAFNYEQTDQFAKAVATFKRESGIRKQLKGSGVVLKEIRRYLKGTQEKMKDQAARKKFTPVTINNIKTTIVPSGISRITTSPKADAHELIAKGARLLHEEPGGKAGMLMYQGVPHSFITPGMQKMIVSGYAFKAGDLTYAFEFKTDKARLAFLKQHKLSKTIKLHHKFDKTDFIFYDAGARIYVHATVRKSGFLCSNMKCKAFSKNVPKEGLCSTCGKRLGHVSYVE